MLYDLGRLVIKILSVKNPFNEFFILLLLIISSFFLVDFLSACLHCFFIDASFTKQQYEIKDGYMVIDTKYGYSSCHHIFPSNWKDISDKTIFTTMMFYLILPFLAFFWFVQNPWMKIFFSFFIIFAVLMPMSHKYCHEKLHNRDVPLLFDWLLEKEILLSCKQHKKHHIMNNYNWSLLNGSSDDVFNQLIHSLCNDWYVCPVEESVLNAKRMNDEDFHIRFIGDISGTLHCRLKDNLFIKI